MYWNVCFQYRPNQTDLQNLQILILADVVTDVSCVPSVFRKNGFGLPGVEATSKSVFYLAVDGKRSVLVQCLPSVLIRSRHLSTRLVCACAWMCAWRNVLQVGHIQPCLCLTSIFSPLFFTLLCTRCLSSIMLVNHFLSLKSHVTSTAVWRITVPGLC